MARTWFGLNRANPYITDPNNPHMHMLYVGPNATEEAFEGYVSWYDNRNGWTSVTTLDDIPDDIVTKLHGLGFTWKNEEAERKIMADCAKLLSTGLLVSSSDFAKLSPAKQTEVLVSAAGKPIVFVESFAGLRNKRTLVGKLVNGEDVTVELEFNEITLTDEEKKVLADLRPILERIRGATGKYPWIVRTDAQERHCKERIRCTNASVNRDGYNMTISKAKTLWTLASAYWAGGDKPRGERGSYAGYTKTPVFHKNDIEIGCQNIQRWEVEFIAEHFGWEPAEPKEKA